MLDRMALENLGKRLDHCVACRISGLQTEGFAISAQLR